MNPTPLNKCKLFVWDISLDISKEDLKNYFGSFGNVLEIYYPPNKPGARFYHCIIAYYKPEYSAKCLEEIKFNNPLNLQMTYAKLSRKDQQQAQLSKKLRLNVLTPPECELLPPVSAAPFIKELDKIPFKSCMFCSQRAYFRCNCDRFCCSNSCLRENWDQHYKVCPPNLRFSTFFSNSSEQKDDTKKYDKPFIPLNVAKFTEVGGHQNNHVAKTIDGKLEPNLTLNLSQLLDEEETGPTFEDNGTIDTVLNSCLSQNVKVKLQYTCHGKYFYFAHFNHCEETYKTFLKMETEINIIQELLEEASFGEFIIAYSRKYEKWYRARFLKAVSSGYFAVFFFDYGNIEVVKYISKIERKWLIIPTPLLLLKFPENITSEDFLVEECEAIIQEANSSHVTVRTTNEPSLLLVGLPFWDIKSQIFKNLYQDSNLSDDDYSKEDTTTTSVEDINNSLNEESDNHSIKEKSSQRPIFKYEHNIEFL